MGFLRNTKLTKPVKCLGLDVLNLIAILPRPRSTLSLCMRRLRIAWILTPVKASIDIVSVLSGAFVEYIAARRIGYRRPEGMRWLSGVAGNYRKDRRLVLINRFGHIGNVYNA
jgi:hypothetical protein